MLMAGCCMSWAEWVKGQDRNSNCNLEIPGGKTMHH